LDKEQDAVSPPTLTHGEFEISNIVNRPLIDFTYHVGGFQADLVGRAPRLHLHHQHPFGGTQA